MTASDLRTELAATAARLIAEEGCEYAQAKRRAVQEVLGEDARRSTMPDNYEVEHELRRYLKLFGGEAHRALLAAMRGVAAETMQTLQEFEPYLIGAVLNGTATEHSDIHLQLFVDSAKDVELRLMNLGVDFDVAHVGADPPRVGRGELEHRPVDELHQLAIDQAKHHERPALTLRIGGARDGDEVVASVGGIAERRRE